VNEAERKPIGELQEYLKVLEDSGNFHIEPFDGTPNFNNNDEFTKLKLTQNQKMRISAFMQQVPMAVATTAVANAYVVKFPAGLPHTLTALNQGGFGSIIRDGGKIVGHASFYPMLTQAAVMGVFTIMSIITGQFFLTKINNELRMMNQKIDQILEFLREDKRAELKSEILFVQGVYQNFNSYMEHEAQRIATITSLQQAKRVAIKDIEFYIKYMNDQSLRVQQAKQNAGAFPQWLSDLKDLIEYQETLEWAKHLLVMSSILEVYYSQNFEPAYTDTVEKDLFAYLLKCDTCVTRHFGNLELKINAFKPLAEKSKNGYAKKTYTNCRKKVIEICSPIINCEASPIKKAITSALHTAAQNMDYYWYNGDIYIRKLQ